jgi:predicted dehydrogenase
LRAGIIGAGFMGGVHAHAVRAAGGVVAAVAASSPEATQRAAREMGVGTRPCSADEMVSAPDVDVIHICTPNHLHEPLALAAIEAGKHVICEKPLATSASAAAKLNSAAEGAGVVASVPYIYRFYPSVRDARARIQRGDAGDLRILHGSYLQDWLASPGDNNWRVDPALGGTSRAFGDIGVHWCDLVEFVSGHRITRLIAALLTAHGERRLGADSMPVETEDVASLLFETSQGAIGSLMISQVTHGRKNRLWFSLDGDQASLSFDQEAPDTLWIGGREANLMVLRGSEGAPAAAARYSLLPAGHPQGYQDCFNAYVSDVYEGIGGAGIPDGLPTFRDGWRSTVLTAAVLESAATQAWVEVPV